ncbi:MAG: S8 family peptidase, partial [Pontixanthobacter sp.]
RGSTIAIIDTGIDADSPEFAGRIHPDSTDVAGNGTFDADDDHGTNIALVAAAARDNTGVVGIAYGSRILALRADQPGSCATETEATLDGCQFGDRDIAQGVDQAVRSGATVINISLGGSAPTGTLSQAIARAAAAGLVIVVSAGNDGESTESGIDPDRPDPFAAGLLAAGGDNVIIVGSVDDNGTISPFSNRAGSLAASYLTARGQRICCTYEDGTLRVTMDEKGDRFVTLFSGTSFSAPQVAGAVALLAQAFPNLTGTQIVEILLDSARDAGAAGTDEIYGTGILDIAAALQPSGTTSLAGTETLIALDAVSGTGSAAMGDALSTASIPTVITDRYDRAYNADLGGQLRSAALQPRLLQAIGGGSRRIQGGAGPVSMAFTIANAPGQSAVNPLQLTSNDAEQARVLAARIVTKLAPDTQLAFGFSQGEAGLVAGLQGIDRPAFLITGAAGGDTGFVRSSDAAFALRHKFGKLGVTVSAQSGHAQSLAQQARMNDARFDADRRGVQSFTVTADRRFGEMQTAVGVTRLQEDASVLGGQFDGLLGVDGADTVFLDAQAGLKLADGWHLGGSYRHGFTRIVGSGLSAGTSRLNSQAWSIDLAREGVFAFGDRLGFRLSQPLRVVNGGIRLNVPIAYDYTTQSATFGNRTLSLSPEGREVMGELAWSGSLWGGATTASLFYRHQPGHFAAEEFGDAGAAIRWNKSF